MLIQKAEKLRYTEAQIQRGGRDAEQPRPEPKEDHP